jgi:hypothetical protein
MLNVTIKSNILSVVTLSVVMLSVAMLNVVAPLATNIGVVKLNVVDDDDASTNPQNVVADVASQ